MVFLTRAILKDGTANLLGLLLTEYDVNDYQGRASVKFYTVDDIIKELPNLNPWGFEFRGGENLFSDSKTIASVKSEVINLIEDDWKRPRQKILDITDFVLFGAENDGLVCPDYSACGDPAAEGNFISFNNFKVSNSSLNIYAPYFDKKENGFKTASLLTLEDGSANPFYALFPEDVDVSKFGKACNKVGTVVLDERTYNVYFVNLQLELFSIYVGDAFVNYLAYTSAYYKIGEDTFRFINASQNRKKELPKSEYVPREVRKPKFNVEIRHECNTCKLGYILEALSKDSIEVLANLVSRDHEANLTYRWFESFNKYCSENKPQSDLSEDDFVFETCNFFIKNIQHMKLKIDLELLRHRYTLCIAGPGGSSGSPILKGGGVYGTSLKRVIP